MDFFYCYTNLAVPLLVADKDSQRLPKTSPRRAEGMIGRESSVLCSAMSTILSERMIHTPVSSSPAWREG